MATAKIRLDVVTLLRLSGIGAFVGLSLLVYYLSVPQSIATLLQLGILLSYGALMTGVITKRPDFEVLAWLLLGSWLLLTVAGYENRSYFLAMIVAVGVVSVADFEHSVVMLYPGGGEAIDSRQESVRRHILRKRATTIGAIAGGSLAFSLLGVNLAPPLMLSGASAAIVGFLAVAVIVFVVAMVYLEH